MPETMNAFDYCIDDDNFDGDDLQMEELKRLLAKHHKAAKNVIAVWSEGDLAGAVRQLDKLVESTTALPDNFYEAKAERLGFARTQTSDGERWLMDGEGPGYGTAKEAVASVT